MGAVQDEPDAARHLRRSHRARRRAPRSRLTEHDALIQYDRIIAQPPFNLPDWGAEWAGDDSFRRFNPPPPKDSANYAFVQHCVAALGDGGLAAILPKGALFRGAVEGQIVSL